MSIFTPPLVNTFPYLSKVSTPKESAKYSKAQLTINPGTSLSRGGSPRSIFNISKKKYNDNYMVKRNISRRNKTKRRKQRGGEFDASQYVMAQTQGNNLLPNSNIITNNDYGKMLSQKFQGGNTMGFVGANIAPATLLTSNMLLKNFFSKKNKLKRSKKKRTIKHKKR
jgi:hypothetical protein